MGFPKEVTLFEVGPRDGLQNEKEFIPTSVKLKLIEKLIEAGLQHIEVGSFVSPKMVPQMADSSQVVSKIGTSKSLVKSALTPNILGYRNALKSGVDQVAIFGSASESFSQRNINCSIDESFERFSDVMSAANADGMPVRGYVSCVLGCPYEGHVEPQKVAEVALRFMEIGCYEVSLGDTIGVGTPVETALMLDEVQKYVPTENLAVHFHDTYGQALANIYVALEKGISVIDSSVAGLGGCPYAKGASGNVATEDVLYMLNGMGINTGLDLRKMVEAGSFISNYLCRNSESKVAKVLATA